MSNMRLLLIFVLTFTLSTQTDNDNKKNNDTETNKGGEDKMGKIMDMLGSEGLEALMMHLKEEEIEILMNCMDKPGISEELMGVIPSVLNATKGINNGTTMCALIREFAPEGPMAQILKGLSDEDIIKMMNCLNEDEMKMLLNMGKGPNGGDLIQQGLKLLPTIRKCGLGKLIGGGGAGGLMNMLGSFLGDGGGLFKSGGGGGGGGGLLSMLGGGGGGAGGLMNMLGGGGGGAGGLMNMLGVSQHVSNTSHLHYIFCYFLCTKPQPSS
ncbi:signal recognition particle 54 kDa protein-like isoform X2 [Crotalus tigris]|uniref:signal recognition particle 54 kDa protein-like isoform X2 n=1 Tax=Crotalus tigris TaxID=88082 RepID=UPI00192F2B67|nr:signal recognition particle 54 kDa protein-like isoform X2 [Crotalus tigris]